MESCIIISQVFPLDYLMRLIINISDCDPPIIFLNLVRNKVYERQVILSCFDYILPLSNPLHYEYFLDAIREIIDDPECFENLLKMPSIGGFLNKCLNDNNPNSNRRAINLLSIFYTSSNCEFGFDLQKIIEFAATSKWDTAKHCLLLLLNYGDDEIKIESLIRCNIIDLINSIFEKGTYQYKVLTSKILVNIALLGEQSLIKQMLFQDGLVENLLSTLGFYKDDNEISYLLDALIRLSDIISFDLEGKNSFIQLFEQSEFQEFVIGLQENEHIPEIHESVEKLQGFLSSEEQKSWS